MLCDGKHINDEEHCLEWLVLFIIYTSSELKDKQDKPHDPNRDHVEPTFYLPEGDDNQTETVPFTVSRAGERV